MYWPFSRIFQDFQMGDRIFRLIPGLAEFTRKPKKPRLLLGWLSKLRRNTVSSVTMTKHINRNILYTLDSNRRFQSNLCHKVPTNMAGEQIQVIFSILSEKILIVRTTYQSFTAISKRQVTNNYSNNGIFFDGFSADKNSMANSASCAGRGVC